MRRQHSQNIAKSIIARWLIREFMGVFLLAVILFLSAGRVNWIMGWAFVGITLIWIVATAFHLITRNPDLIPERLGPKKGSKSWDNIIMTLVGLSSIAKIIIAGIDIRYGWTTRITLFHQVPAFIISLFSYGLVFWATTVNPFFSQIVRIQKERCHSVVRDGPYRFVRHPGYLGTLLFELCTPIMLGAIWALIPGIISGFLFIIRTILEDKTLLQELAEYKEYTHQVSYRLIPGVW